jgi:flavocytochrome c
MSKSKVYLGILLVMTVCLTSTCKTTESSTKYQAGTYTETVRGMAGRFDVTVTFNSDAIKSINVGENNETLMVGTEAIRILSKRIVENQSLNVDVVSGATYTSSALILGVRGCVEQAGGNVAALLAASVTVNDYDYANLSRRADIIIVGGGLAGITAAINAVQAGGNVILLEAKEYAGGNSVLSTGTFQLGGTNIQKNLGIDDDPDTFYHWILENSGYAKDPVQSSWVAYHGQELIDHYASMGVNFNTRQVNATDGSRVNRGHALSPTIGNGIARLVEYMNNLGVDIRYATRVTGFILNNAGEITGVKAVNFKGNTVEYFGNKIVLASGGWAENNDMIGKYWGADYDGLVYGGAKGMDGALLNATVALGADLVDMDDPHIDATLEVTKGITITTNVLRSCGGILIRQSTGQRFADEQASHSEVAAAAMHDIGDPYYYEIFDSNAFDYSEAVAIRIQAYIDMGLTAEYTSVNTMAEGLGVNATALTQTLTEYNSAVRGETPDKFGRERFFRELSAPYYVMKVSNGVACTTGGLRINENMQVVNTRSVPIPHLYAIGEIAGGYLIHYVGGDSLARSSISGMLLGKRLAVLAP